MEKKYLYIFLIILLIIIILFLIYKLNKNKENFELNNYDVSKEEVLKKLEDLQETVNKHNQLEKKLEALDENYKDNKLVIENKEKLNKLKQEIIDKSKEFDNLYSLYEANKLTTDYTDIKEQLDRNMTDKIIQSKINEEERIKKDPKITYPKRYLKKIGCYPRQTTFDEQYLESLNHSINRILNLKDNCNKNK